MSNTNWLLGVPVERNLTSH